MGALSNAVLLMRDEDLRDLVYAAIVYQSKQVVVELATVTDHALRLQLAEEVLSNPNRRVEFFQRLLATETDIATNYTTGLSIPENTIISKMASFWTAVARVYFT